MSYFIGFICLGCFLGFFRRGVSGFFDTFTILRTSTTLVFGSGSIHPLPNFCLFLVCFRLFGAVLDEVPVFLAAPALERELFVVELLEVGPASYS